jgi:alpha-L-fucosidase
LHHTDVERLAGMRQRLQELLGHDLTKGKKRVWRRTGPHSATVEIDLGRVAEVSIVDLGEEIAKGQLVARYTVEGSTGDDWKPLSKGTTIGYRKLDRVAPTSVQRVRLTIEDALDTPLPVRMALY